MGSLAIRPTGFTAGDIRKRIQAAIIQHTAKEGAAYGFVECLRLPYRSLTPHCLLSANSAGIFVHSEEGFHYNGGAAKKS